MRALLLLLLAACSSASAAVPATAHLNPSSLQYAAGDVRFVPESRLYQGSPKFTPPIKERSDIEYSSVTIDNELVYSPLNVWVSKSQGSPIQIYAGTSATLHFAPTKVIVIMQALIQGDPGRGVQLTMPGPRPR
jgi:hypothetical protein